MVSVVDLTSPKRGESILFYHENPMDRTTQVVRLCGKSLTQGHQLTLYTRLKEWVKSWKLYWPPLWHVDAHTYAHNTCDKQKFCVFMYSWVCMFVYKLYIPGSSSIIFHLIFETGPSLNPGFANLARLAGQWIPGICLFWLSLVLAGVKDAGMWILAHASEMFYWLCHVSHNLSL